MLARIARSSPLWRRKRRRSPSEPTRCGRRSWLLQQRGDSGLRAGGDHGDTAQADDIRCQSRRMRTSELPWRFRSSWRRSWWSGQVIRRSPGGCPRARFGSHPWSTPMVTSTAARTNGSGARTADETRTARSASILTGIMDPCGGSSTSPPPAMSPVMRPMSARAFSEHHAWCSVPHTRMHLRTRPARPLKKQGLDLA